MRDPTYFIEKTTGMLVREYCVLFIIRLSRKKKPIAFAENKFEYADEANNYYHLSLPSFFLILYRCLKPINVISREYLVLHKGTLQNQRDKSFLSDII